jgi:hypothetical protein
MDSKDLLRKLDDAPFKPFRLRMANNTVYDIVDPGMIIVGDTSAVVATQNIRDERGHLTTTDWRTISIHHIVEFADLAPRRNGAGRKKK